MGPDHGQQARLVALAPALAPVSLSLNSSAALGVAVGALVIADGEVGRLAWVAAGFSLAALLFVVRPSTGLATRVRGFLIFAKLPMAGDK